jgi:hypothetical protein
MNKGFDHYVKQPEPTQTLWRYLDLSKFLSFLSTQSLFFAQWPTLSDPMEGLHNFLEDEIRKHPQLRQHFQMLAHTYLVSCWVVSEHESLAMWLSACHFFKRVTKPEKLGQG